MFYENIDVAKEKKKEDPLRNAVYCDHPECYVTMDIYPRSGPRLCETHKKEIKGWSGNCHIGFEKNDLDPRIAKCSRKHCTELDMRYPEEVPAQWLFHCSLCRSHACAKCAKNCHKAGHEIDGAKYRFGKCTRTEIQSVKTVVEAIQTAPSGKKRKVTHAVAHED